MKLFVAMCLLVSGCLVPKPEPFQERERTPPFLDLNQTEPPVERFLDLKTNGPTRTFTIPVRSEDLGEELTALVYLDFNFPTEQFVYNLSEPPSTFDDVTRTIKFPYSPELGDCSKPAGEEAGCCRQLKLLVMHRSSLDLTAIPQRPDEKKALGDLALAVWWLGIDAPDGDPTNLLACPRLEEVQP